MDGFHKEAIRRLPLAESVMLLFRHIADEKRLQAIWDQFRGRCYDRVITFPLMVRLVSESLLVDRSGRRCFSRNIEQEQLSASIQAAYQKLGRLPIAVSQAFLLEATRSLWEVFAEWSVWKRPSSLRQFQIIVLDGKAIKHVARRLKPLRGTKGGLLGGRALVAMQWETGLAFAMHGDPDGEANEIKYTEPLMKTVRGFVSGPMLSVGDRAFCDLVRPQHFTATPGDHFLVRYQSKTQFHRDISQSARQQATESDATIVESCGWLGSPSDARRIYVRRIELQRPNKESLVLITDLLDAHQYPATELLWVYRERWTIEQAFQKVTEVFGLSNLIGTSPQATIFQFSFCLLMHNLIQVIRGYIAQNQRREPSEISTELLFRDVEDELRTWTRFLSVEQTTAYFSPTLRSDQVSKRLHQLLKRSWTITWLAAPPQAVHNQSPQKRYRAHHSVHRLLHGPPPKKKRVNLASTANHRARIDSKRPLQQ